MSQPRLLVLNEYYAPGVEATAQLLTDLCEALTDSFEVTVVTGQNGSSGSEESEQNGVRVIRVASTSFARDQFHRRAVNYLSYSILALRRSLMLRKPDMVFCMTDPPFLGAVGLLVAKRFRVPLVVSSQDVFPEIAVKLGRLKNPLLIEMLRGLVTLYLRHADAVVAIGETMQRRLEAKGAPASRIHIIPNWVDTQTITPRSRDNAWARGKGLVDSFVVMHSGNVGYAQDLDTLIRVGTFMRDVDDFRIVIVGSGARSRELEALAERLDIDNIDFLPYQPREQLPLSLSAASVHFVGLARGLAGYIVPSRLYGILAAGRPVIVGADADSETAQVVERVGAGVTIPPGQPAELARVIREAYEGRLDLEGMGARAREFVVAEADRSVSIARYQAVFREALASRRAS